MRVWIIVFHLYWTSVPDLHDPEQDAACNKCMDDWIKSSFFSKPNCVKAESTATQRGSAHLGRGGRPHVKVKLKSFLYPNAH